MSSGTTTHTRVSLDPPEASRQSDHDRSLTMPGPTSDDLYTWLQTTHHLDETLTAQIAAMLNKAGSSLRRDMESPRIHDDSSNPLSAAYEVLTEATAHIPSSDALAARKLQHQLEVADVLRQCDKLQEASLGIHSQALTYDIGRVLASASSVLRTTCASDKTCAVSSLDERGFATVQRNLCDSRLAIDELTNSVQRHAGSSNTSKRAPRLIRRIDAIINDLESRVKSTAAVMRTLHPSEQSSLSGKSRRRRTGRSSQTPGWATIVAQAHGHSECKDDSHARRIAFGALCDPSNVQPGLGRFMLHPYTSIRADLGADRLEKLLQDVNLSSAQQDTLRSFAVSEKIRYLTRLLPCTPETCYAIDIEIMERGDDLIFMLEDLLGTTRDKAEIVNKPERYRYLYDSFKAASEALDLVDEVRRLAPQVKPGMEEIANSTARLLRQA